KESSKQEMKIIKTSTNISDQDIRDHNETQDFEENENLLMEGGEGDRTPYPVARTKKPYTPTPDSKPKIEFGKQSEEEKEFKQRIDKHRKFFKQGEFTLLEDCIDQEIASSEG